MVEGRKRHESPGKADNRPAEGGLWGWLAVVGLFITLFFVRGMNVGLGIFFVSFVEYFKEGAGNASWMLSLAASLSWMIGPVSSACAKRFGHRKVGCVGALLSVVALVLSSFSSQLWQLTLTVGFLNGLGYGILTPISIAHIAVYFRKRHPLASGIAFTGLGAGSMALPPLIQMLIDTYGWRGALVVFAGMSAHLLLSGVVMVNMLRPRVVRDTLTEDDADGDEAQEIQPVDVVHNANYCDVRPERDSDPHLAKKPTNRGCCSPFRRLFGFLDCTLYTKNPMFVAYTFCFAVFSIGQVISAVHLAPHLEITLGSKQKMAWSLTSYGLGLIVGGPVWGFFISRYHWDQVWFMVFINMLHGVTIGLFPLVSSAPAVVAYLAWIGFQRGGYSAQAAVTVRRIVDDSLFLTAIGWNMFLASIGQFFGPPISGYLRDYTGNYHCSFYLACAFMFTSSSVCGIFYFVHNKRLQKKKRLQLSEEDEEEIVQLTEFGTVCGRPTSKRQSTLLVVERVIAL